MCTHNGPHILCRYTHQLKANGIFVVVAAAVAVDTDYESIQLFHSFKQCGIDHIIHLI